MDTYTVTGVEKSVDEEAVADSGDMRQAFEIELKATGVQEVDGQVYGVTGVVRGVSVQIVTSVGYRCGGKGEWIDCDRY